MAEDMKFDRADALNTQVLAHVRNGSAEQGAPSGKELHLELHEGVSMIVASVGDQLVLMIPLEREYFLGWRIAIPDADDVHEVHVVSRDVFPHWESGESGSGYGGDVLVDTYYLHPRGGDGPILLSPEYRDGWEITDLTALARAMVALRYV